MAEIYFILSVIAVLGLLASLPGTLELLLITIGNFLPKRNVAASLSKKKIAVIVPAHNEEKDLANTLISLKRCWGNFDLIVIADNCTDSTADVGHSQGARVFERKDSSKHGKQFALQFAFDQLSKDDYEAYLIIDADTIVSPNLIEEVQKCNDAVQVTYVVKEPQNLETKSRLLYLASVAFNYVRPDGRNKWGLSCGLFGNGFCISKKLIEKVPLPQDSIVEDLSYHLKLVESDYKVAYNDAAAVYALPPKTQLAFEQQRSRWEGGRLRLMKEQLPHLLKGIFRGKWRLIEPTLDLLLLPLSYHVLILLFLLFFCISRSYAIFALSLVFLHVSIAFVYGKCGWTDFKAILSVPFYLLWKLKFIRRLAQSISRGMEWIRTDRR